MTSSEPSTYDRPPTRVDVPNRSVRPLASQAKQVLLFVNRKAGAGRRGAIVEQAAVALERAGLTAELIAEFPLLQSRAHQLQGSGDLRAVVAVGGDGTVSAVLNATPRGTPIVVLPMGTENLLARYAGYLCSPAALTELLTKGVVAPLDAGRAGDQLYAMMLSAGFDAEVVRQVHRHRRGNITHLAYAAPIFRAIGGYRFPKIKATWFDEAGIAHSAEGCWAFLVNLPRYALGLPLAPNAVGTDGMLDLCFFKNGSKRAGLWYFWQVVRGRHHLLDSVQTARAKKFTLEPMQDEVPYQIDGDPGGLLPVEVSSEPGRMELVLMPAAAEQFGFATS